MMKMFESVNLLQSGVAAASARTNAHLENIANVDTPNYKAVKVTFEEEFANAVKQAESGFQLKKTRETHMDFSPSVSAVTPQAALQENTTYRMDGNNVDIDSEMTDFSKNVLYYNTLLRKMNGQFEQLRTAIKG